MSARTTLSVACLLLTAACVDNGSPLAPVSRQYDAVPEVQGTQVVDGSTGPGALYRFVVPENWNGSLLLYAHGYVAPDQPVTLPAEADLISSLLAPQGFEVAYSSFSENGFDSDPRVASTSGVRRWAG